MSKPITIIIGPTAIGKSSLAIETAKKTGAVVISADAFQVYRGMDIGTGKVLPDEQQGVPHYLIDVKNIDETFSVQEFLEASLIIINECQIKNRPVIICGGTGFYIHSFLYQLNLKPGLHDESVRKNLLERYEAEGAEIMWNELHDKDPVYAKTVEPNNRHRVVRALELITLSGKTLDQLATKNASQRQDVDIIGLTTDRDIVYDRIHQRIDKMFQDGWIEEVKQLMTLGFNSNYLSFKALGYPEIVSYLNNGLSRESMLECIKQKSRHFAKRQYTWFKKLHDVRWTKIA